MSETPRRSRPADPPAVLNQLGLDSRRPVIRPRKRVEIGIGKPTDAVIGQATLRFADRVAGSDRNAAHSP
jgi:hypothetical protein